MQSKRPAAHAGVCHCTTAIDKGSSGTSWCLNAMTKVEVADEPLPLTPVVAAVLLVLKGLGVLSISTRIVGLLLCCFEPFNRLY